MGQWMRKYRKYQSAVRELLYRLSEIEMHHEAASSNDFERYVIEYCSKNNIDIEQPNRVELKTQNHNKYLVQPIEKQETRQSKLDDREFLKVYKTIARQTHPDKFSSVEQTDDIREKVELFKIATKASKEKNWAKILEVAEILRIRPSNMTTLTPMIRKESEHLAQKIAATSTTFGVKFFYCESDECRHNLLKSYLKLVYNIQIN